MEKNEKPFDWGKLVLGVFMVIATIVMIAWIAVLPAMGQQQEVVKNAAGNVEYVKVRTSTGYIVKDKMGRVIYRVVETEREVRVYDAEGRIVRIEKKDKDERH